MAETVKINIETVGTQQAAAQTKTLRQQIKDLRTELEGLTEGTAEYNSKLTELGNAMHQQQEITEQARMATQDYGATLGNLSSVASGVVGSIAAVNGVMNLLGASSDSAEETIRTMTSLIGIIQGLSALDEAGKNFEKLWGKVKKFTSATKESTEETKKNTTSMEANSAAAKGNAASMGQATTATKAQGVAAATTTKATNLLSVGFKKLNLSIKAFMMSNPFTLILLAITSIVSAVSNLVGKFREARIEAERLRIENLTKGIDELNKVDLDEKYKKGIGQRIVGADPQLYNESLEKLEEKATEVMDKLTVGANALKEQTKQAAIEHGKQSAEYIAALNAELEAEKEYDKYMAVINQKKKEMYDAEIKSEEELDKLRGTNLKKALAANEEATKHSKEAEEEADKYLLKLYDINEALTDNTSAENERAKNEEKKNKEDDARRKADAKAATEKAKNDALARIKAAYDLARKLEENAYANEETAAEEHYARLKEIEDTYYAEYTDIMNGNLDTYKKYITKYNQKQQELESAEANHASAILSIEKDLATELQKIREWQTDPSRGIALSRAEREKDDAVAYYNQVKEDNERLMIAEEQTRQQRLDFDEAWYVERLIMLDRYTRDAAKKEREASIESLKIQRERQEAEMESIRTGYGLDVNDENAQYDHDLQVLKDQYEARLITQQEYEQRGEELTNEHLIRLRELEANYTNDIAQAESDLSNTRLQIQQEEFAMEQELFEQKQQMIKTYISAFSSITSAVSSLLSEVQAKYKEGTKEYEQIAETMLIMQTIEGSLAAFVSGVESGLPAPWNFALGAVLAGLATATGVLAIQNLKSKKLSSSAANAPNVNPYETLSYETNSNIEGNIADTRVYVLEEDITNTQNRVSVAEDEASW